MFRILLSIFILLTVAFHVGAPYHREALCEKAITLIRFWLLTPKVERIYDNAVHFADESQRLQREKDIAVLLTSATSLP